MMTIIFGFFAKSATLAKQRLKRKITMPHVWNSPSTWADIDFLIKTYSQTHLFSWVDLGDDQPIVAVCDYSGKVAITSHSLFSTLGNTEVKIIPHEFCEAAGRCLALSCPLNRTTEMTLRSAFRVRSLPPNWKTISDRLTKRVNRLLAKETEPARSKADGHETRAIRAARTPLKPRTRWRILTRDGFRCCACGRTPNDGITLHVDHIVPVSKGGSDQDDNLQTMCQDCNLGKGVITHRVMHS